MNRLIAILFAFLFHIWTNENTPRHVADIRIHNVSIDRAWQITTRFYPHHTIILDRQHWPKQKDKP